MMCLSTRFQQLFGTSGDTISSEGRSPRMVEDPKSQVLIDLYQKRTVQCLTLSHYTKGGRYVLKALVLYTMTEIFTSKEIDSGVRLLVATIFQVGVNMGCHRDGSHFPNISLFEGEMRRRIWALIIQMFVTIRFPLPTFSLQQIPRLVFLFVLSVGGYQALLDQTGS